MVERSCCGLTINHWRQYPRTSSNSRKILQRLLLRLQQYDFEIRYKPGPEMYLSDTLSPARDLPTTDRFPAEKEAERIHGIYFLPISELQLVGIQHETAADPVMQSLTQIIVKGWPDTKDDLPLELDVRDELTAQYGVVFKGLRCLIPSRRLPTILEINLRYRGQCTKRCSQKVEIFEHIILVSLVF